MTRSPSKSLIRRLVRDERGVSAVEFALLAPILILFYFGMTEFCQAYMAQKRSSHAASMVGDLVAQATDTITADEVGEIFNAGRLIMRPFTVNDLGLRVSSVTRGADGVVKVDWSRGLRMDPLGPGDSIEVPDDLIANGESLVVSTARYEYESPVGYVIEDGVVFNQTHYLRPRAVEKVACSDC